MTRTQALLAPFRYALAIFLGGQLGALLMIALRGFEAASGGAFGLFAIGLTLSVFGVLPALIVGFPAMLLLVVKKDTKRLASVILAAGGALVGAFLLWLVGANGLESLGAFGGGSIGFVIGLLFVPSRYSATSDRPNQVGHAAG